VQSQFFRFLCFFLLLFQVAVSANSSSSCDHLGTPKELYNAQGECVWQAQHSLWGKLSLVKSKGYEPSKAIIEQNAGSNDYKEDLDFQLPNHSCELRFAGQWFDAESGLHYNYNRYYDPNSGQYLSQDPIGLAGGFRTQAYVADPVHWVDPLGLAGCGRLGKQTTRDHVEKVADQLEGMGYKITNGARGLPEEYIPGAGPGNKGSSYPDITATKTMPDGTVKTVRVNTVDTRANGKTMTTREATNAARIRAQKPGEILITIPKPK
jgi:RHS repeat-associated protein